MRGQVVRKPVLFLVSAGVLIVVAAALWFVLGQSHHVGFLEPGEKTRALVVATAQSDGGPTCSAIVLLSVDPGGDSAIVGIPPDLWLKKEDGTFARLGEAYLVGGAAAVQQALAAFLDTGIPNVLVLDEQDCLALLQAAAPLDVSVTSPVVYTDESLTPPAEVDIVIGDHAFDAETALAYVRGDSDKQRIRRVQELAQAVVASETSDLAVLMRDREPSPESNLSSERAASLVGALVTARLKLRWDVLPTSEDVGPDGLPIEQPRIVEIEQLMLSIARGERPVTPADVRVAVFNGNGGRLVAGRAAAYLEDRGFQITTAENADRFTYEESYLVVLTDQAKAWLVQDTLPAPTRIVYPDELESFDSLAPSIPQGTDIALIVGAGMELGE